MLSMSLRNVQKPFRIFAEDPVEGFFLKRKFLKLIDDPFTCNEGKIAPEEDLMGEDRIYISHHGLGNVSRCPTRNVKIDIGISLYDSHRLVKPGKPEMG